ncbi:MAG: hypothetical protein ACFFA4_14975 [Promethearchaeota archaeon]
MGKIFGLLGLIFGLIGIIGVWFITFFFYFGALLIGILAIVFGGIGIAKDDSKGLGIAGLILGIITLIIWFIWPILALFGLLAFFAGLFP